MKSIFALLINTITLICNFLYWSNSSFAQIVWTQKADFAGGARYSASGFAIGTKGYIGTGYNGSSKQDFWEFDPTTNVWTSKMNFGGISRWSAVGFSIGTKGYMGTGFTGSIYPQDFWEYNQATNSWSQKANFPGTARQDATGFAIGNKGYIGTGWDGNYKKDLWEYDVASNTWMSKSDFGGSARSGVIGFSIGSKGYFGTGITSPVTQIDFWAYDPATNIWTQKANFGGPARNSAVGFSIEGKGYVGTGESGVTCFKDFWEYDTTANTWSEKANFCGVPRSYGVGFSIGTKGYIGTGKTCSLAYTQDFWEYGTEIDASFSTNISTTCSGDSVFFINNSTGTNSYFWNFGDSTTSTLINPAHFYSATGTYTIMLIASSGSCGGDTTYQTVTISPSPQSGFSLPDTACGSDSVQFNNTSAFANSFVWNFGDGTTSSQVSPVHSYAAPGLYSIMLIAANGACADDTTFHTVTIISPSPQSGFNLPDTACAFDSVLFTNTSAFANSFQWNFGDSTTSSQVSPVHSYTAPGLYSIMLVAANSGCSDTVYKFIFIKSSAFAGFSSLSQVCSGDSVLFTNSSTNADSVMWYFGDGNSTALYSPGYLYNDTGAFNVKLIAFGGACGSDTASKAIYISPNPTAAFSVSDSSCSNDSVKFINTSSNATNFVWSFGDSTSSSATNPVHLYADTLNYSVVMIAVNNSCTDTISKTITIVPAPVAVFTVPSSTICKGDTVLFSNTSSNSSTYLWNFGNSSTSTAMSPSFIYNDTGIYSVSLIVSKNICRNDTALVLISVLQPPKALFSNAASVCTNQSVSFTNNSTSVNKYLWKFGDGSIDTLRNTTHSFLSSGDYTVSLIATGLCGVDTAIGNISVNPYPVVVSSGDTAITLGKSVTLSASGGNKFLWSTGETGNSITVSPPLTTTYFVTVSDSFACSVIKSVLVSVSEEKCVVFVPSIFTPNGDGLNDKIFVRAGGTKELFFTIYDRWGEQVFETTDKTIGWDGYFDSTVQTNDKGDEMRSSVFVYYVKAYCLNGEVKTDKGNITLIR